jgi:hypothetical protein
MYQVTFQSSNCDVHRQIGYANAYEGGVNYRPLFLIDVGHDVKVYRSLISNNLYHLRNKKVRDKKVHQSRYVYKRYPQLDFKPNMLSRNARACALV